MPTDRVGTALVRVDKLYKPRLPGRNRSGKLWRMAPVDFPWHCPASCIPLAPGVHAETCWFAHPDPLAVLDGIERDLIIVGRRV